MIVKNHRVVLLHSALGDSRLWRRQVPVLGRHFDVVAPDLPGFGETPLPREAFSFVDAVTPHLPGALVGNSFGGMVALRTACAHPELVEKLVLVASALPDWQFTEEMTDYWALENAAIEAGDLDAATEENLAFWVAPEHWNEVRPQARRAAELQTAHDEPPLLWPERFDPAELTMPVMIVAGTEDKADFKAIAQHLAEQISHAQLVIIEGAGHLVGIDRPDALNQVLLDFLTE
jgi:3-oxoadipate enol-lactonase